MVILLSSAVSQISSASPPFPRLPKSTRDRPSSDRLSGPPKPPSVVPSSTDVSESPTLHQVASLHPGYAGSSSDLASGPPRPEKFVSSSIHTVTSESPKPETNEKLAPEILFFHNPASKASVTMLSLMQRAQKAFPQSRNRTGPPLDLKLTILERLPTVSELQDMYSLHNEGSWTIFHANQAPGSYRTHPTSARSLLEGIEHARKAEVAKAKQNPEVESPHEAATTHPPSTDSLANEPSATEPATDESIVLDIDHPLFGTQIFAWPVIVCWEMKEVLFGANSKQVHRLLKDFASNRDGILARSIAQEQEEERKARQAHWTYPKTEVSPDEDDTLRWFNESSKKPGRRVSW